MDISFLYEQGIAYLSKCYGKAKNNAMEIIENFFYTSFLAFLIHKSQTWPFTTWENIFSIFSNLEISLSNP